MAFNSFDYIILGKNRYGNGVDNSEKCCNGKHLILFTTKISGKSHLFICVKA